MYQKLKSTQNTRQHARKRTHAKTTMAILGMSDLRKGSSKNTTIYYVTYGILEDCVKWLDFGFEWFIVEF